MTEQEFKSFLNRLNKIDEKEILILLLSEKDEISQHKQIFELKEYAMNNGITKEEFDLYFEKAFKEYEICKRNTKSNSVNDFTDAPPFRDTKGKFLHNIMGDYLIEKCYICKINGALHLYQNGLYVKDETLLNGIMIQLLPEITDRQRKEVLSYIRNNLAIPVKEISPPYLIPFKSRIYNNNNNTFLKYNPDFVFLSRFPYDYDPEANEPGIIEETIFKIANNDTEIIDLIYEAIGNCFYRENIYRGAVLLYGAGNNGKSTLLNAIIQLLGRENVSYLSLQDTAERFRLAQIYGKCANIGDDIPNTYFADNSLFKKLVTGEAVTAENKGQDPFTFCSFAKMFFAMNDLPPISDKTDGMFSRLLILPLTADFSKEKNLNVDLKNRKWTENEMQYLLKQAMDGLKRLRENGHFTKSTIAENALQTYRLENNPIAEFIAEYKENNGDIDGKPTAELYSYYASWCQKNGHKNVPTKTTFTREVNKLEKTKSEPRSVQGHSSQRERRFIREKTTL